MRNPDSKTIAQYNYDAHGANSLMTGSGSRITKVVTNSSDLDDNVRYLHDGIHCIEEQRTNGSTQQYVYGMRIDEPVQFKRAKNHSLGEGKFFSHQKARGDVVAVTDSSCGLV